VDAPLVIRFSEKVDDSSLERALWVTPGGAVKPKVSVSGEEITIRTGKSLPESTTIGVLLTTAVRDRKRETEQNPLRRPVRWVFSTGDRIWPGVIRGLLDRAGTDPGERTPGTVFVAVYPASLDSLPDLSLEPPLALTQPDSAGRFELTGLPARSERLRIVPLYDRDGNRAISGQGEFVSAESETLILSPDRPEAEVSLRLVDPEAPGSVTGILERAEGDTLPVWLELYTPGPPDTAAAAVKRGQPRPDGGFSLAGVAPGTYRVTAFCDGNANGKKDPGEPVTELGSVTIRPGTEFTMDSRAIPACRQPGGP
jgi:hypothetical protein